MQASEHEAMLMGVASKLGDELLQQVTFVGGATVSLHLDDAQPLDISSTKDVDFIVSVTSYSGYHDLSIKLRERGFTDYIPLDDEKSPMCRFICNGIMVDVMPDDEEILGFSNAWFKRCHSAPKIYTLPNQVTIRIAEAKYLLATKLAAFAHRGQDMLSSKDAEDIIILLNGRDTLVREVLLGPPELRDFIQVELTKFIRNPDFKYVFSSSLRNEESERQELTMNKLNTLAGQV